jgi:hypothetical protein
MKIFNGLLFFTVLCVIMGTAFGGTTGKISGVIKDAQTGDALPGVNVVIDGTQMGAATDINGEYFIINVPPGEYSLTASMIGYTKVTKTDVRVKIDQTTQLDFDLQSETIAGEEVTIIAERPVVELDLTASKQVMSSEDITSSFVTTVEDVISIQQGVNYQGGIRGGFDLDVSYMVDGMEVRDVGSNSNYKGINTSSIQEIEVLTGGYNAEFGRANGAVINIVTKNASDKLHGSIYYRNRPPGIYHWGGHMYDPNMFESSTALTTEFWEALEADQSGIFTEMSPVQLAQFYRDNALNYGFLPEVKDYDERWQHELESTLYGPITDKLSFMVSGRYKRGVPKFPSILSYNPEWHGEVNLDYRFTPNTILRAKVMHGGFDNSNRYRTKYSSSEDNLRTQGGPSVYVPSALARQKYRLIDQPSQSWRSTHQIRPPEYVTTWGGQLKLSHTFNPSTFVDVKLMHFQFYRHADWFDFDQYGIDIRANQADRYEEIIEQGLRRFNFIPRTKGMPFAFGQTWYNAFFEGAFSQNNSLSIDLTSQINSANQIKAGAYVSLQYFNKWMNHWTYSINPFTHDSRPYEGAFYIQDKIETKGMIINAGVRVDMFNGNEYASPWIHDPLAIHPATPGNKGAEVVSMGDPYTNRDIDDTDYGVVKTPTRWAVSPRVGISHPITESTVFHFMYGHFNQRPPWHKIIGLGAVAFMKNPMAMGWERVGAPWAASMHPDVNANFDLDYRPYNMAGGNPAATFEKMIQYEVGFDQNIADILRLDATMYYKDAKNLTATGFANDRGDIFDFGVDTRGLSRPTIVRLPMDPETGDGRGIGRIHEYMVFANTGYQDVRGLEFELSTQFRKWFNVRGNLNMSYSNTGQYGIDRAPKQYVQEDGTIVTAGNDRISTKGGSNWDRGNRGNDNEYWNPNMVFQLFGNVFTPMDFGPKWGNIYPLGDWNVNVQFRYNQGPQYTYYPSAYVGVRYPNNMRWEALTNTNLKLSKGLDLGGIRAILGVNIYNVFNEKALQLHRGQSFLENYHENGQLPFVKFGFDEFEQNIDDEWLWYNFLQLPREIVFELGIEF